MAQTNNEHAENIWSAYLTFPNLTTISAQLTITTQKKHIPIPTSILTFSNLTMRIVIQNKNWPSPAKIAISTLYTLLTITPSYLQIHLTTNSTTIIKLLPLLTNLSITTTNTI